MNQPSRISDKAMPQQAAYTYGNQCTVVLDKEKWDELNGILMELNKYYE